MATPRKSPLGIRHPAAHQNFAPIVSTQPRKEVSRTTYKDAEDFGSAIRREARELGYPNNLDLMTSLVLLGHKPEKIITLLTKIFEAQNQTPARAKLLAEKRLALEYEQALKKAKFLIEKRRKVLEKKG